MRSRFDEQLAALNSQLTRMGALCEQVIAMAVKALEQGDIKTAKKVASVDNEIDQMERDIEALCLRLLLQQQPVARDLRQISAALKMITDMERIGDQAADIAEIVCFFEGKIGSELESIQRMAKATIHMVTESIEAYVSRDISAVREVIAYDDVVDEDFEQVKTALIAMIAKDHQKGEYALDLLMIAKYFERIGDHAVNIAEWVEFSINGVHKDLTADGTDASI